MKSPRIIAGPRAVEEALKARPGIELRKLYVIEQPRSALLRLVQEAAREGLVAEERGKDELDRIAGGHKHQGIVALAGPYRYVDLQEVLSAASGPPLILALDQITDPYNFGAMIRSAVAFGADGIITLKDRAAPVTPVVVRASAGATEHAKIVRATNLARTLQALADKGMSIVGLDAEGEVELSALPEAPEGRVLVVGAEGSGLRRLVKKNCTLLAKISHPGAVASLNASVAASIALFCAWGGAPK